MSQAIKITGTNQPDVTIPASPAAPSATDVQANEEAFRDNLLRKTLAESEALVHTSDPLSK